MTVIKLTDQIETNFSGIKKLLEFYYTCREHANVTIHIDFYHLNWIDANLSSLLDSMLFKLNRENNLLFSTDINFIESKFDILLRNGFIKQGAVIIDDKKSCVMNKSFSCEDKEHFINYIENDLMAHRGMPPLLHQDDNLKEKIIDDLIEIFCNSHFHANTKDPFFVAGQYYPNKKQLIFTMVDLGDGFLPRIQKATNGLINTSLDAIKWALEGNSSKLALDHTTGGLGLSSIYKYCKENNGELEIITGNGYWSSSYENTLAFKDGRLLNELKYVGTIINLTFQSH